MNEEDTRKEMFAWYGAAMYAAQLFEVELVILLLTLKRLRDPDTAIDELNSLESMLERKTLGGLLKELEKHTQLSDEFKNLLIGYRDQRNFLAHEFFYARADEMRSVEGVNQLISELQGYENRLRRADQIAMKMSTNTRIASGIDEDEFQKYVEYLFKIGT